MPFARRLIPNLICLHYPSRIAFTNSLRILISVLMVSSCIPRSSFAALAFMRFESFGYYSFLMCSLIRKMLISFCSCGRLESTKTITPISWSISLPKFLLSYGFLLPLYLVLYVVPTTPYMSSSNDYLGTALDSHLPHPARHPHASRYLWCRVRFLKSVFYSLLTWHR